jgi:hypothetical protein
MVSQIVFGGNTRERKESTSLKMPNTIKNTKIDSEEKIIFTAAEENHQGNDTEAIFPNDTSAIIATDSFDNEIGPAGVEQMEVSMDTI